MCISIRRVCLSGLLLCERISVCAYVLITCVSVGVRMPLTVKVCSMVSKILPNCVFINK